MGNTKLTLNNIFLFLFFILFPFGQIIRIGILQPIDLIVGIASIYCIFSKFQKPAFFKYLENFLIVATFSWIFGAALFRQKEVFYGLLYLIRLAAYIYFLIYVWSFAKKNFANKKIITGSMISVSVFAALFGWIQYFAFPNIKPFIVWGWDDHLFRLVGTFLDPTFLGIIIVFGLLISVYRYIESRERYSLFISLFLLISLAFTYSRASYLAFLGGLVVIGLYQKKFKQLIYIILGLILLIALLPTSGNHILGITRAFSAIARVENYTESLQIYRTSPVFGVGYDNLCLAKSRIVGYINYSSHACSGFDSSLLFILSTTGIAGIIVFVYAAWNIGITFAKSKYKVIIYASGVSLIIHSLFSNSLVYPWVLGWMIMLLSLA